MRYTNNPTGTKYRSGQPAQSIIGNVHQRDVFTSYNGGAQSLIETIYNAYGVPREVKQYDYGVAAPPTSAPLIDTVTTFGSWSGSSCSVLPNQINDRPCEVIVKNAAGTLLSDTRNTYDNSGNLLKTSQLVSGGTYLTTNSASYNTNGSVKTSTDANGNVTTYTNAGCEDLLPTEVTISGGLATAQTWNCDGAVLASSSDYNGQKTTYSFDDPFWRPTAVAYPDGGSTSYSYSWSPAFVRTVSVQGPATAECPASSYSESCAIVRESDLDGLGRPIQDRILTDPAGTTSTDTSYDLIGRVQSVSNPYRTTSDPTYGITANSYDALGRKTYQCQPDNASTQSTTCTPAKSYQQWCYNGVATSGQNNCLSNKSGLTGSWVDFSDEVGNHSQRTADALGRLTAVMEPTPHSNTPTLKTIYTYDALNNLLNVNQIGVNSDVPRVRSFTYDSLSRLLTSTNPESGKVAYSYTTSAGALCSGNTSEACVRTDARGVVTNYTYDALNRLTAKTYPTIPAGVAPTPTLSYSYDSAVAGWTWHPQTSPSWPSVTQTNLVGRLAGVVASGTGVLQASIIYGYDPMGRTLVKAECLPSDCGDGHYDQHYRYDLAGNLTFYDRGLDSIRNEDLPNEGYYFGGYTQSYNGAARLVGVTGDTGGTNATTNILSDVSYYPAGQMNQSLQLGVYNSTRTYSNRGWYTGQTINDTAGQYIWTSTAGYDTAGRVTGTTDRYAGTWSYTYDYLNRLSTAAGPQGSVSYTIDDFGNKTTQAVTAGTGPAPNYNVASTNALTGNSLTYDLPGNQGNVTYDGFHYYTYDGEGRLYSVGLQAGSPTTCYTYDGEGDRVATSDCSNSASNTRSEMLYDFNHRLMTEISTSTYKITRANLYAGDNLIAEDSPDLYLPNTSTATQMRVTDQVGSLRSLWDLGSNWSGALSSFPYGDGAIIGDGGDSGDEPGGMLFTGKKQDSESGLNYFGARYYSSIQGRFLSPDPSGLFYADPSNPQSLNLYSYVQNNPLINVDPNGLDCIHINVDTGDYEGFESGDCDNSTEEKANSGVYVDGTVNTITTTTGDVTGRVTGYSGTADNGNLITGNFYDLGQSLQAPTHPDPDQQIVDALVQGIAQDTRSFPTLCNVSLNLRAQIPITPLSVGVSADRNGVHPMGRVSATSPYGGVGISTNGKNTGVQVTVPFSAVLNGSVSTSQNKVTLGLSRSVTFGGKLSAGASLTLGYIGDASCR